MCILKGTKNSKVATEECRRQTKQVMRLTCYVSMTVLSCNSVNRVQLSKPSKVKSQY